MSNGTTLAPALLALAAPVVAAVLARVGDPAAAARRGARALALGAAAAVVPVGAALAGRRTDGPGIEVDAFTGLALLLVLLVGATVLAYGSRNLRGEAYQRRFATVGPLLVLASSLVALASDLVVLGAAWAATSLATVALLRTGPAGAGPAVRATRAFVVGDAALLAAVAVLALAAGGTSIAGLAELDAPLGLASAAGVLVVVAALARSAAGPFSRWLPDSLGAPTPSSALLHAGVVNGGAIAMVKLAPVTSGLRAPALVALVVGSITCVLAEAAMVTRRDVKGQLAWSTIAQMSFTTVLCGLGLHAAAALHLVAHGLYKGALFLGSGSAVRGLVRRRTAPPATAASRPAATAAGFAATGLVGAAVLLAADATPSVELAVPLGLAWTAAGCATGAALHRIRSGARQAVVVGLGSAAMAAYVAVVLVLKASVVPVVDVTAPSLSALLILPVIAGLLWVAATRHATHAPGSVRARAWALARDAARPVDVRPPRPVAATSPARPAGAVATRPSPLTLGA